MVLSRGTRGRNRCFNTILKEESLKVLVTGANGMFGTDLVEILGSRDQVIPTDVTGDMIHLDITNTQECSDVILGERPDVVVHCAAYTDVDGCERDPDKAYKLNALGTWNIASACNLADAAIVYVSTDFVFDGEKGEAYTEYDSPNPVSKYGASKYAGEQHVRALCSRHYIARTAWLYGENGKNFPFSMMNAARAGKKLTIVADQTGSPTFTRDLAYAIKDITASPLYGTYHLTNSGSCTWYDFALEILSLAGIKDADVSPISSKDWPSPTRRPEYSVLRHYSLELQGRADLRHWKDALAEFMQRIKP
jgi:dTDP-4-dehydrorhamnose reductase